MVYANPMQTHWEQRATIVRARHSLTGRDTAAVRASVRAEGDHYDVEEHVDYDGYVSLLLTARDDVDRAFLVSGRKHAVTVSAIAGDSLRSLGTYPDVADAMAALQPALDEHDWRLPDRGPGE